MNKIFCYFKRDDISNVFQSIPHVISVIFLDNQLTNEGFLGSSYHKSDHLIEN